MCSTFRHTMLTKTTSESKTYKYIPTFKKLRTFVLESRIGSHIKERQDNERKIPE